MCAYEFPRWSACIDRQTYNHNKWTNKPNTTIHSKFSDGMEMWPSAVRRCGDASRTVNTEVCTVHIGKCVHVWRNTNEIRMHNCTIAHVTAAIGSLFNAIEPAIALLLHLIRLPTAHRWVLSSRHDIKNALKMEWKSPFASLHIAKRTFFSDSFHADHFHSLQFRLCCVENRIENSVSDLFSIVY